MRFPGPIESLLPCPNTDEILDNNSITPQLVRMHDEMEGNVQHIADLLAVSQPALEELSEILGGIVQSTGSTEIAEEKGQIDGYRSVLASIESRQGTAALDEMADRIETAVNRMGTMACTRCAGVVIDRTTGIAYCGREAPSEIADANS